MALVAAADATRQFEAASLFIDDCPDGTLDCRLMRATDPSQNDYLGSLTVGKCWGGACCNACDGDFTGQCRTAHPDQCDNPAANRYCKGFVFGGEFSC